MRRIIVLNNQLLDCLKKIRVSKHKLLSGKDISLLAPHRFCHTLAQGFQFSHSSCQGRVQALLFKLDLMRADLYDLPGSKTRVALSYEAYRPQSKARGDSQGTYGSRQQVICGVVRHKHHYSSSSNFRCTSSASA